VLKIDVFRGWIARDLREIAEKCKKTLDFAGKTKSSPWRGAGPDPEARLHVPPFSVDTEDTHT
jgi:hypothetical protein